MSIKYRLVIVSGFSAAGKTTHARLVASHLGWHYLGTSELRRSLLTLDTPHPREWDPSVDIARLETEDADRELDRIISERISSAGSCYVVDSWLQPWLYHSDDAIRVWINSDLESRVKKAIVSRLRNSETAHADMRSILIKKDRFSIEIFRRLYNVNFGYDRNYFSIYVDNSSYICEPTIKSSDAGIRSFQPVLESIIDSRLAMDTA